MMDEYDLSKADILRQALTKATQEALSEVGDEVLLNKWVFVADLIIDGERTLMPIWDENMDAIDIEAVLAPAYRMSKNITDMFTVGVAAGALDAISMMDDDEEDEDEDYD